MIEQAGGRSLAVSCDVTCDDEIEAALDAAADGFGRPDIAFNNAGIEQPTEPAAEISDDEWDRLDGRQPPRRLREHEARDRAHARAGEPGIMQITRSSLERPKGPADWVQQRRMYCRHRRPAGLCQRQGGSMKVPVTASLLEPGDPLARRRPNRFMVHVAMQQNDDTGSPVTWGPARHR